MLWNSNEKIASENRVYVCVCFVAPRGLCEGSVMDGGDLLTSCMSNPRCTVGEHMELQG